MLARIVGILLGLALGGLGYAILDPRALEGRIPPIPLGAFQPEAVVLGWVVAGFGLVIFIAALMPKGPPSPGGGKRRRGGAPVTVDFTSASTFESPGAEGPMAAHSLDQEIAARALAEALATAGPAPAAGSPQPPGAPPGGGDFTQTRLDLHAQVRSEDWSQAAATLRRLSSLAGDDRQRLLAALDAGDFARAQGQAEDAAEAYGEALAYARRLGDPEALADGLTNCGDMAYEAHRLDEAAQAYEEGLDLRRGLVEAAPWNAAGRRALSLALERLADLREDRGHRSRALDLYRESLEIAGGLARADPARYGADLAVTRQRLAELEARVLA